MRSRRRRLVLTLLMAVSLVGVFAVPVGADQPSPRDSGAAPPDNAEPAEASDFSIAEYETANVDDDSVTDRVGLVDPETGIWYLRGVDGEVTDFYFGNPGDIPFAGDWNCDGVDTPGLYRQSDGFVYLRNSNTQGVADIRFFFGNPGDVPLAGDFDDDGCDTVSIYRASEARFYIINELGEADGGLGAADYDFLFGNGGDKPFVGDFDGDGVDTVGLHRESTGLVYFRNSNSTGIADDQFFFGDPGDRLVAGDWGNVNGVDSPAVYRPTDATFYFRYTNTQGIADEEMPFGAPHHRPIAGTWAEPAKTAPSPSASLDDPSEGAGNDKNESGESGGPESDVDLPENEGGGGAQRSGPTSPVEPPSEAGSAPSSWTVDPSLEARPGTRAAEDTSTIGWRAVRDAPIVVGSSDYQPQFCTDNSVVWWGLNCGSQPVFSHNAEWLNYNNLPLSVGQLRQGCTGTLVGLNVVLTAAHCVAGQTSFTFTPDLYGGQGVGRYAAVGNPGVSWSGTRRVYHAEFLESKAWGSAFDYALIVLDANGSGQHAGDVYGWTNVFNLGAVSQSLARGYYTWNTERHQYGYPLEGWWGLNTTAYQNKVDDAVPFWCGSNEGRFYNFGGGLYTMGMGCQGNGGDSGGPIYHVIDGKLRLVSVVSTGSFAISCEYKNVSGCKPRQGPNFQTYTSYYMYNTWGPPLLNTTGPYGYDDISWIVYNTTLNGPVCTGGTCP